MEKHFEPDGTSLDAQIPFQYIPADSEDCFEAVLYAGPNKDLAECALCGRQPSSLDLAPGQEPLPLCPACTVHFQSLPDGPLKNCLYQAMAARGVP